MRVMLKSAGCALAVLLLGTTGGCRRLPVTSPNFVTSSTILSAESREVCTTKRHSDLVDSGDYDSLPLKPVLATLSTGFYVMGYKYAPYNTVVYENGLIFRHQQDPIQPNRIPTYSTVVGCVQMGSLDTAFTKLNDLMLDHLPAMTACGRFSHPMSYFIELRRKEGWLVTGIEGGVEFQCTPPEFRDAWYIISGIELLNETRIPSPSDYADTLHQLPCMENLPIPDNSADAEPWEWITSPFGITIAPTTGYLHGVARQVAGYGPDRCVERPAP